MAEEKQNIKINKINEFEWEIPKTGKMNVPVRIFASEKLLDAMKQDKTLEQASNVATLPGIINKTIVCPDAHQGYGFSIGGVAAMDLEEGIITPGGIGFDINCGLRLLASNLTKKQILDKKKQLIHSISRSVPKGVGRGGAQKINREDLKNILEKGAKWAVENGFGFKEDLEKTEDNGCISGGRIGNVSERAIKRGLPQLGSLGAGNHFLEIQEVEEIYNEKIAKVFGIKEKGQVMFMIHCGSRGLGHQVASDYIKEMEQEYGFEHLPDRELVNAPIKSKLGQKYFSAMAAAANFGFTNRHLIMHYVRKVVSSVFPKSKLDMVYDVAHNVAKIEEHDINGKIKKVLIMRKGATRSFGSSRKELPPIYRKTGQPVIIPGSMGTASYVLVGTKEAEKLSFSSTAHGAGRVMSRHAALRFQRGEAVKEKLNKKGIDIESGSSKGLAEEAPEAYKDVDEVVNVSDKVGIGKLVAKLKPLAVMKG